MELAEKLSAYLFLLLLAVALFLATPANEANAETKQAGTAPTAAVVASPLAR